MDSKVEIQELTSSFDLNGKVYLLSVEDHLGSFSLPRTLESPLIEVKGTGFYFNEITGLISGAPITLGSYSSLEDHIAPNINILTTLAQKRIKHLVLEENISFLDAETQAKNEVLLAFRVPDEDIKNFDELSIMGNENGDAILLAISVILQGNLLEGELTNFISNIREDIRDNGQIDSEEIYDQICRQTKDLNPIQIRENLINFYERINAENYFIHFFEDYLDSDCDGTVNKNDQESFISSLRSKPDFFNAKYRMSIQDFNNSIWIYNTALPGLFQSYDLKAWEKRIDKIQGRENVNIFNFPVSDSHFFKHRDNLYIYGGEVFDENLTFNFQSTDIFINNFYQIDENDFLYSRILGLGYNEGNQSYFEHELHSSYDDETVDLFRNEFLGSECEFRPEICDTLAFQYSQYRIDEFDELEIDSIRRLAAYTSSKCHRVFEAENQSLFKVSLKKGDRCTDHFLDEEISIADDSSRFNQRDRFHELFDNPNKNFIENSRWSCDIFRFGEDDYEFDSRHCNLDDIFDCENDRNSINCQRLTNECFKIVQTCLEIHARYNLRRYDELFYIKNIQDIIYFQNHYFVIAQNTINQNWYLYKMPSLSDSEGTEIVFDLTFFNDDNFKEALLNQFYIYEEQLFIFNSYKTNMGNIQYSTTDGIQWNIFHKDYYNRYIDLTYGLSGYTGQHNPFLFKDFIHRPLRENKISILGKYKYYRNYLKYYFNDFDIRRDHSIDLIDPEKLFEKLVKSRINQLVIEGLSSEEADIRAKEEILSMFSIDSNFDELDINAQEAILLAISMTLKGNSSFDESNDFIMSIIEDISDNGIIDNQSYRDQICENSKNIAPLTFRSKLIQYYEINSIENRSIPFFEDYLDSDCNGVINNEDPESFIFFKSKITNQINWTSPLHIIEYQDNLFFYGDNSSLKKIDNNLTESEIIIFNTVKTSSIFQTLNDQLFLIGGRTSTFNSQGERVHLNSLSLRSINEDFNVETLRSDNFNEIPNLDEYLSRYTNDSLEDNTLPNFSNTDHHYFNYNNQTCFLNKYTQNSRPSYGFVGVECTSDFTNLDENNLTNYISEHIDIENISDIKLFNNRLAITYKYPSAGLIEIHNIESEELIDSFNLPIEINRMTDIKLINYNNYFLAYDQGNTSTLFVYDDRGNWEELLPSLAPEFSWPFVYRNMLHSRLNFERNNEEGDVLIYGKYQYYQEYIESMEFE